MSTVQCLVCGQVKGIEWKRLGVWDGWHGHGMTSIRRTEKAQRSLMPEDRRPIIRETEGQRIQNGINSAIGLWALLSLPIIGFLLLKNHSLDKEARFWRSWKNACVERYGEVPQNYLFNSKGEFRESLRYDEPL